MNYNYYDDLYTEPVEVKANYRMFKDILNNKSNNNKNILSNVQPKNKITAYNYDDMERNLVQ